MESNMIKYKIKKLIIITVQVLFLIGTVSNNIYAAGSAGNSGMYSIYNHMNNPFTDTISMVIGVIQAVGMATAVITLTIIGIKYILTSPEGKAEVKKQMYPYLVGCVLLFAGSWLVGVIANVANDKIR